MAAKGSILWRNGRRLFVLAKLERGTSEEDPIDTRGRFCCMPVHTAEPSPCIVIIIVILSALGHLLFEFVNGANFCS